MALISPQNGNRGINTTPFSTAFFAGRFPTLSFARSTPRSAGTANAASFRSTATNVGGANRRSRNEHAVVTVTGSGGGPGVQLPLVAVGTKDLRRRAPSRGGRLSGRHCLARFGNRPIGSGAAPFAGIATSELLTAMRCWHRSRHKAAALPLTLDDSPSSLYAADRASRSGFASYRHTWGWFLVARTVRGPDGMVNQTRLLAAS